MSQQMDRVLKARQELTQLVRDMQSGIMGDTASAYEVGMTKVMEDVKKKADELKSIKTAGVDTKAAEELLKQYQTAEMQKVIDAWTAKWNKLRAETKTIQDTMAGDFRDLAESEYEATITSLDKEKAERLKDVARTKDDLQAKAAVEEWYVAKVEEAQQKLTQARREAFDKAVQYEINQGDTGGMLRLLQSQQAQESKAWEGRKKSLQTFYQLWDEANVDIDRTMAETATSFASGLSNIFTGLGSNIKNAGDLAVSVGKLILNELAQVAAKALAARIAMNAFGNSLTGSSSSGGSWYSGLLTAGLSGISGGGTSLSTAGSLWMDKQNFLLGSSVPFANGGIVTAPTLSLLGEGRDKEAVFPLNSQTYAGLAKGIVGSLLSGSSGRGSGAPVVNITNTSNAQVGVESAHWDDEIDNYVLNIVVHGVQMDKGGVGSALKQLLK
jgi:hypothetical protein